jgi:uncharacterized UBP type Zn finger protein
MSDACTHLDTIHKVTPGSRGCEECLKLGWEWFHLRVCRTCGHVGCCDQSRGKHATKHFHHTRHPIIEGYDPPEGPASRPRNSQVLDINVLRISRTKDAGKIFNPMPLRFRNSRIARYR